MGVPSLLLSLSGVFRLQRRLPTPKGYKKRSGLLVSERARSLLPIWGVELRRSESACGREPPGKPLVYEEEPEEPESRAEHAEEDDRHPVPRLALGTLLHLK
jgi:hypothetical protein